MSRCVCDYNGRRERIRVDDYCPEHGSLAAPAGSDEVELRRMLAWAYSGHHLYCDDGELQDSREHPIIDFKRDAIAELKDKMEQRGLNRLHRELHQNDEMRDRHPSNSADNTKDNRNE